MTKKMACCFLIMFFAVINSAWTQDNRMSYRADSVSRMIDSLINSQSVYHFMIKTNYLGDTTTYFRQYYIDTSKQYLLKCIVDTTFDDYYKRTFRQVVIYFNQGY